MPDGQEGQEATQDQTAQFNFDSWLGEQPEHVRTGLDAHTAALRNALQTERDNGKEFKKQLRELSAKAEKGSELEVTLAEMTKRSEQAEQRAAFFEDAGKAEIACTNPKAAYLIAQADGLFTRSGAPDWNAIKTAAPELFGRKAPPGNAGSGNGSPPPKGHTMNDIIRAAAGRG